ncbi:MAG: helix-turn-helix transcriptional regulator [Betaproteobacteria bacterium]
MEKLVLDEHDLSARWGVNVKTLKRWQNEGRGPRYIKIGRSVTYLPKDIEHFETHALYGRSLGAVEPLQLDMSPQSSSRAVVTAGPRSPRQEIVDLLAVALLRLRAAGPPPSNPSETPTVNEVGKEGLARRRFGVRVLSQMTDEG